MDPIRPDTNESNWVERSYLKPIHGKIAIKFRNIKAKVISPKLLPFLKPKTQVQSKQNSPLFGTAISPQVFKTDFNLSRINKK